MKRTRLHAVFDRRECASQSMTAHACPVAASHRGNGFTLIEVMTTLAVAASLVTLALPMYTSVVRNSEIRSTTESIVKGLRVAQSEAMKRNTLVSFTLVAGGESSGWAVKDVRDDSLIRASAQEDGGKVRVVTQPAAADSVTFNYFGRIVPDAAGTPTIQQLAMSSAVTADARTLQIHVDELHGFRVCDPSPSLAKSVPPDSRAC